MDSAAAAITWLLRVLSTLAQAVFAKVSAYIPVLLVFDFVVTSWIVCHFLGMSSAYSASLLVYTDLL